MGHAVPQMVPGEDGRTTLEGVQRCRPRRHRCSGRVSGLHQRQRRRADGRTSQAGFLQSSILGWIQP